MEVRINGVTVRPNADGLITTSQVREIIGYADTKNTAQWLRKRKVPPAGRELPHGKEKLGQTLYQPVDVEAAIGSGPGRGRRTDLLSGRE